MPDLTFFLSACFASIIQLASRSRRNSCSSMVLADLAKSRHSFVNRLHSDVETSMSLKPFIRGYVPQNLATRMARGISTARA
jgi:hypothetical protein